MIIKSLLDTDLYKFTMMQFAFHQYRNTKVAYRFLCRNKGIDLSPYAKEIEAEIKKLCTLNFNKNEIDFLRDQELFQEDFLAYLKDFKLNPNEISVSIKDGNLSVEAEGIWCETILYEVFVLSIVNEVYFRNTQPNANKALALSKLYEKIKLVKELNSYSELNKIPVFKFIDFGTRRRFSSEWQGKIDKILKAELPENFVGTSSVYWAMIHGLKPVGTMAHEFLQFFQSVSPDLKHFQRDALFAWLKEYDGKLSIALTDVITTDAFLNDLGGVLTREYSGCRHDSNDPFKWSDKLIKHYQEHNIDPKTKTLVFSDGLNFPKSRDLYLYTVKITNPLFGIGTDLSNDWGFKPLNIVMKMVKANGKPVAKISDEPSKGICDDKKFFEDLKVMFKVEE